MNKYQLMYEGFWRNTGGLLPSVAAGILTAVLINVTAIMHSTSSNDAPAPVGLFEIGKSAIR